MKKLTLLTGFLSLGLLAGITFWALPTVAEMMETLQSAGWWYSEDVQPIKESMTQTELSLITPKLLPLMAGDTVTYYHIFYTTGNIHDTFRNYSTGISEFENFIKNYNSVKSVFVSSARTVGTTGLILSLSTADSGFSASTSYCALIIPADQYNQPGNASQQFCFNLAEDKFSIGYDETLFANVTSSSEEEHAATTTSDALGTTDMRLANITHTITGDIITLIWTKVGSAEDIDLYVFGPGSNGFIKVATVKTSAERYAYQFSKKGEYIFNFIPSDGGREVRYSVNALIGEESTPTTPETTPPDVTTPTGPRENVIAIVLLAIVLYGGYVIFGKKQA